MTCGAPPKSKSDLKLVECRNQTTNHLLNSTFHLYQLSNQGAGSGRLTAQTDKPGKVRSKQAWKSRKPSHANTFL